MKLARVGLFAFLSLSKYLAVTWSWSRWQVAPCPIPRYSEFQGKNHGLLTQPGGPPVNPVEWRMSGCSREALPLPLCSSGCRDGAG